MTLPKKPSAESPTEHARRINRTWIVHGSLAADTERYLAALEQRRPDVLAEVCARAVQSTRIASREQRDPKPDFYTELFRQATDEERAKYLQNHPWTQKRLAQARDEKKHLLEEDQERGRAS